MKKKHAALLVSGIIASSITYAEFEITSLSKNGELEWQHSESNGFHIVEWSSSPSGVWKRSWPQINLAATGGTTRIDVPMFYRVVWSANSISGTVPVLSYNAPVQGETKVYQGTWDSDGIRVEITDAPFIEVIGNRHRLVYPTRHFNYNESGNVMALAHTVYEYADETSWIIWKEIDADNTVHDQIYSLFKLNMSVNEITTTGSRLIESGTKVFPELGVGELEYAKLQVSYGDSFSILYIVKGHGEYVLKFGETDDSQVQRYLIYAEGGDQTVGTKPAWFDSVVFP